MSKIKIVVILLAVNTSIATLNGQKYQLGKQCQSKGFLRKGISLGEIKEVPDKAMTGLELLNLNLASTGTVSEEQETWHIITRRTHRVSHKSSTWGINRVPLNPNYPKNGTYKFANIYVGLNNWLVDGKLPKSDKLYSLSPINSWYAALTLDNLTKVSGPVYFYWGVGISYMNFAFNNTRVRVTSDPSQIFFTEVANISGQVSKLRVTHLNLHFVPTISLSYGYESIRFGLGVYGGYRIGSSSRMKFNDANGNRQRETVRSSFHINPFRYGIRGQLGWSFFDLFVNYDLTNFFHEDAIAPRLRPFTIGMIF